MIVEKVKKRRGVLDVFHKIYPNRRFTIDNLLHLCYNMDGVKSRHQNILVSFLPQVRRDNYYQIDWRFGQESDLQELIDLCHQRNIKLILDVAINHTSNQHEWFVKFKEARINGDTSNEYYDYYSCATSTDKKAGASYQKIAGVDCYYECNFSGDMPELNLENPKVRHLLCR